MKRFLSYYTLLFLILIINNLVASDSCIHGRVINNTTKQPISNVNIYLANTSIGTTTNSNGYFEIKMIPKGTFDIIFSHVAYYYHKEKRLLKHLYNDIGTIELSTKTYQLPTVLIEDDEESLWNDQFENFVEEFIGESENADSTYIADPYKIDFWENDGKLFASCNDPIEIINRSLGYRIEYFLDNFESSSEYTKFSGNSVFTPLFPNSKIDSLRWSENRDKAYLCSFRHFLTTLNESYSTDYALPKSDYSNNSSIDIDSLSAWGDSLLNSKGFFIYKVFALPWESPRVIVDEPISINGLLSRGEIDTERYLSISNYLRIYFIPNYNKEDYTYNFKIKNARGIQSSFIELEKDSVMIDIFGRYYDKYEIHTYGKFGQQRIADMLPYEYKYNPK